MPGPEHASTGEGKKTFGSWLCNYTYACTLGWGSVVCGGDSAACHDRFI